MSALYKRFRAEAEDLEQHLRTREGGDPCGIERWRNFHNVPADDVQAAEPLQQALGFIGRKSYPRPACRIILSWARAQTWFVPRTDVFPRGTY